MIKSYRTKRRKIQNDLMLLNCNYESDISLSNNNNHKIINQPLEITNLPDPLSSSISSDKSLQSHVSVNNIFFV